MKKRGKILFSVAGIILGLTVVIVTVIYINGNQYRKQLPPYPDFNSIPTTVQEQISGAGSKAKFIPTADNLGNLGMIYHASAYYDKAALCYKLAAEQSLESNKRKWIWNYYLGYLNLEMGESKAAIEDFKSVMEKNPGTYQALFYIGEAWQNLGDIANAENVFKRIAGLDEFISINQKSNRENFFPIQTYAKFRLARIYLNSNRLDSAEMILKQIIARQWTFGPAYRLLGEVYNKKGNADLGKKFVARSSDLSDYSPPQDTLIDKIALISRSDKYILKQIEDAKMSCNFKWELELCNHALKYIPDNKYLLSNSIILYFTLGKDKEVLPLLNRHLKAYGEDFEEVLKIANLLSDKGLETEALKYIDQAKKLQPDSPRIALWLFDHGKKDQAIKLINSQLKKNPNEENTLTEAVRIYLNLGEKEKTTEYLSRLKKLNPSNLEAKKATALLYQMEGNEKAGLAVFEDLTKNGIKDMPLYRYLARYYFKNQLWDKAILNFRQVLQIFPNDPESMEGLGRVLISCPDLKLRNPAEGMEYSERAFINFRCSTSTRVAASRNIATAAAILGEKQKAAWYINQTMTLVQKANMPQEDYMSYFDVLRKQYQIN